MSGSGSFADHLFPAYWIGKGRQTLKGVLVTPELAIAYLKLNTSNYRGISPANVDERKRIILDGAWQLTHQGIAFSEDGKLSDGQHRLKAIAEVGIAVPMDINFNEIRGAEIALDGQKVRTTAQILRTSPHRAATIRIAWRVLNRFGSEPGKHELPPILAALTPYFDRIEQAFPAAKRARTAAPVRLACILRMMNGDAAHALAAFQAFVEVDLERLPRICRFVLQDEMKHNTRGKINKDTFDTLIRYWIMLDPKKADLSVVQLRNPEKYQQEIRSLLRAHISQPPDEASAPTPRAARRSVQNGGEGQHAAV